MQEAAISEALKAEYPEYHGSNICMPLYSFEDLDHSNPVSDLQGRILRWKDSKRPSRTSAGWTHGSLALMQPITHLATLARFVFKIGCELAEACQPFGNSLSKLLFNSPTHVC